jgi:hypothetical protein
MDMPLRGDVMQNTVKTPNSRKARSTPRSVIIATSLQETLNDDANSERMLADRYANAEHSCFDDAKAGPDQYAEFQHSYF